MPLGYIYTSLPDSAIPSGFETRFAQLMSKVLPNKQIERISVVVVPGSRLCKGGSTEPAMLVQIRSIATFDAKKNKEYFPQFFNFLTSELNLAENRFAIEFVDIQATNAMGGK